MWRNGIKAGTSPRATWLMATVAATALVTAAHAHTCGPTVITMYPGDVTTWQITAATAEVSSEYNVPVQPNAAVATAAWPGAPVLPFVDHHATFEITAIAPGTTSMTASWYHAQTNENGFCEVQINVLPPASLCQVTDPPGDAISPNTPPFVIKPDIVESSVTYNGTTFLVEVICNAPVMLPSQGVPMSTFFNIEFDTDNDTETGWEPLQDFTPWLPNVEYGAEAAFFINWDEMNHPGQGNLIFFSGAPGYLVPVTYSGNTISFDIPEWVLMTTQLTYAPMVGNMTDWTDALSAAASSCGGGSICEADLDVDGDVDADDAAMLDLSFGTTEEDRLFNPDADFDSNGAIDLSDLGLFGQSYNCPDETPMFGGTPEATVSELPLDPAAEFDPISPLIPGQAHGFMIHFGGTPQPNVTAVHATITIDDPLNAVSLYIHDTVANNPWMPPDRSQFPEFPALQHTTGFRFSADASGFFTNTLGETGGEGLHWKAEWDQPETEEDLIGWFRVEQTAEGGSIIVQAASGVAGGNQQLIGSISVQLTAAGYGGQIFSLDFDIVRIFNPGDIDGDGSVDVDDLLAVIGAWGSCPPPCPADVNDDGTVDVDDLLLVIGNWS
jgi:hypothetical protein